MKIEIAGGEEEMVVQHHVFDHQLIPPFLGTIRIFQLIHVVQNAIERQRADLVGACKGKVKQLLIS